MKLAALIIFLFLAQVIAAQNERAIDSLESLLSTLKTSEEKIDLTLQLSKLHSEAKDAQMYARLATVFAENTKDKNLITTTLNNAYAINYSFKDYKKTLAYLDKLIEKQTEWNDSVGIASSLVFKGSTYKKLKEYTKAIDQYKAAASIYKSTNNLIEYCQTLNKTGILNKNLKNYTDALELYYEAYEIEKKNDFNKEMASTCLNIGVVYKKQQNFDDALIYYNKALEAFQLENNYYGMANVYNNIGNVNRYLGNLEQALIDFKTAIKNRKLANSETMLSYTYNNIAITYQDLNQIDSALVYLKKSEDLKIKNNEEDELTSTYLNYTNVYLELNDTAKFNFYHTKALQLAIIQKDNSIIQELHIYKGKMYSQNGEYQKAYENLIQSIELLQSSTEDEALQKSLSSVLQAKFNNKQNVEKLDELSKLNAELSAQKAALKEKETLSNKLIIALAVVSIIIISFLGLLILNFYKLKNKSSELSLINEELSSSKVTIQEKETLLKEVHHRVKNNLQIIKSLIRLQNNNVVDQKTQIILKDFEQRVSTMALVHESIYKGENLDDVNVKDYFNQLVETLLEAYSTGKEIQTKLSINIEKLEIDTLIPLGLLTNEIISNALKHGLNATKEPLLTIELNKLEDTNYRIYIGDNGKGFPADIDDKKEQTLGLELIDTLVEQLDGTLTRSNEGGAYYKIDFKKQ